MEKLDLLRNNPELAGSMSTTRATGDDRGGQTRDSNTRVDMAARLLPNLDSESLTTYFIIFERTAALHKWDKAIWTQILNIKLDSKCMKIVTEIPVENIGDYEIVKKALLDAHQITPYTYMKEFKGLRKKANESFMEFAFKLESLQKAHLTAMETNQDPELIRQVYLQDQFMSVLPNDLAMYVSDHKAASLHDIAKMLDNHCAVRNSMMDNTLPKPRSINTNYNSQQNSYRYQRNYNKFNRDFKPKFNSRFSGFDNSYYKSNDDRTRYTTFENSNYKPNKRYSRADSHAYKTNFNDNKQGLYPGQRYPEKRSLSAGATERIPLQTDTIKAGGDITTQRCFRCNKIGHHKKNCKTNLSNRSGEYI